MPDCVRYRRGAHPNTGRVAAVISGPDAPDIAYSACVLQSSRKREAAAAFLSFLQTADAARVFERYGFKPIVAGQ